VTLDLTDAFFNQTYIEITNVCTFELSLLF